MEAYVDSIIIIYFFWKSNLKWIEFWHFFSRIFIYISHQLASDTLNFYIFSNDFIILM